jgi:hypothetical protein
MTRMGRAAGAVVVAGLAAARTDHRRYLEELHDAVLQAARASQFLEEMQASITLERYRDWGQHEEWLPDERRGHV